MCVQMALWTHNAVRMLWHRLSTGCSAGDWHFTSNSKSNSFCRSGRRVTLNWIFCQGKYFPKQLPPIYRWALMCARGCASNKSNTLNLASFICSNWWMRPPASQKPDPRCTLHFYNWKFQLINMGVDCRLSDIGCWLLKADPIDWFFFLLCSLSVVGFGIEFEDKWIKCRWAGMVILSTTTVTTTTMTMATANDKGQRRGRQ